MNRRGPSAGERIAPAAAWLSLSVLLTACGGSARVEPDASASADSSVEPDAAEASVDAGPTDEDMGPGDAGPRDAGRPDAGPIDAGPQLPDEELAAMREACVFGRGAHPLGTVGNDFPRGEEIPIDHFILVMMENRSFDSYFGTMPGVDGIPEGASNPRADGTPVEPFHATDYCIEDVAHSWGATHRQYNDGANDGLVVTNDPGGERALGYLDESDLPFYWDLYRTFAMSDRHFSSVLSSTWTNRWYYFGATSFGQTSNDGFPAEDYPPEPNNLMQQLDEAGLTWTMYQSDGPSALVLYPSYLSPLYRTFRGIERLMGDLETGDLPAVSWVEPSYFGGVDQSDEHPPANPQLGQAFVSQVVRAVMASPLWERTAIILTYDEHGGFYDHVAPPEACPPDDRPPVAADGTPRTEGIFDRLGIRVPLAVISPYAREGYVSHRVTDHSSIVRLVQTRFGLGALTARDANAWPLLDMFDFDAPPRLDPPDLEEAVVDAAQNEACRPFLE